ncbi:hypothetical protein F4779DRAFT_630534 [Xylariaceae sp. FL0662B]|nr:hypothetical protein F4779DRAFT_630534 [Xylariaceae sp. FL0662B]
MSGENFRVIIVGAGPVGLYMAHAMERANIQYIVLEQQTNVLNSSGQLLFTWPQTVRLLDQLELYQDVKALAMPMHYKKRLDGSDGRITSVNRFWDDMEENHGYPFLPMLRSDLIKILYLGLKGRDTKIKVSAEVEDIETFAEGVRVHLKNGATVEGSLVIGADGVHSKTRKLMHKLAKDTAEESMVSSFYGIFGQASVMNLPVEPEVFFESRGAGAVIQCLGTQERLQFVALKPLPKPSAEHRRYTREDAEQFAASIEDVAICPGITFKDIWTRANKNISRMLNQEEGFMTRWYYDRIVLVGDSAHKSTSVNGLGMTCGLHSAAVLANLLQGLASAAELQPSVAALNKAFALYQKERESEVKPIWNGGYSMIREVTQRSWVNWFWDRYILPWIDVERFARGIIPSMSLIRHGNILSYVPFVGQQGRVPWVRRPVAQSMI